MKAPRIGWLFGVGLVGILVYCWTHSYRSETTTAEVRANLEKNDPEKIRQWAFDFVRNHPVPTNTLYARRGERLTHAPFLAIRGVSPYVFTSRTEETEPLLVCVEWDRYGAKAMIGTTNFHFTNAGAIPWTTGIYIKRGSAERNEQ